MASNKIMKIGLTAAFSILVLAWAVSGTYTKVLSGTLGAYVDPAPAAATSDEFVGSETCKACHEDQFKKFSSTKHAKLDGVASWKDKAHGCEGCHGSGKAHVEGGGDKTKIISFKGKDSKEVSETCLSCHSGKESHNQFRRGEHWRNNVGCTDCHTSHGMTTANSDAGSNTYVGDTTRQNPSNAAGAMLKQNDPQLCLSCHAETKAQFAKPFHHKVLEGTMKCSDCHNAHGGFESKQTKLAVGVDASCVKCHANKQGPFVYEHGPLKLEGCSACHIPHGSSNPKLLKRNSVRQLCFECHTGITEEISPQAPSLHNQAQVRYLQCNVCHSAVHGSNSSRFFFR